MRQEPVVLKLRPISHPYSIFAALMRMLFFILIFAALAVGYVAVHSQTIAVEYQIEHTKSEIQKTQDHLISLNLEKAELESYARLEGFADKMGMKIPETVYFINDNSDFSGATAWKPDLRARTFRE